jgi:hypothetical protein
MSLKDVIQIEPVRTLSAILAFGAALITGLAYNQHWSGEAVGLIAGGWSGFIAVIGTLFTRNQVTPNVSVLDKVHDTIVALSPYAPVVTEAIVPVASSPLLDSSVVVTDNSTPVHPPTQ